MEARILLTREKATVLFSIIHLMTGSVSFRAKREEVQGKLKAAWPEIMGDAAPGEEVDRKEKRPIILCEREQKAMGEGLLSLVRKPEANGADYSNCLDLAETLRIRGWFRKAATVEEVPEFDGTLDGEEVSDAPAPEAEA